MKPGPYVLAVDMPDPGRAINAVSWLKVIQKS